MEVSDLVICALVALVTLLVAAVFYESKAARAGDAAGEGLSERDGLRRRGLRERDGLRRRISRPPSETE